MRFALVFLACLALAGSVSAQSKPRSKEKALAEVRQPDPVKEFETLVARCKAAVEGKRPSGVSVYERHPPAGLPPGVPFEIRENERWGRQVRIYDFRYDVKKTESLVSPVVGVLEVTELNGVGTAPDETAARALKFTAQNAEHGNRRRDTLNYAWRDGAWEFRSGTSVYETHQSDGTFKPFTSAQIQKGETGNRPYAGLTECLL